tara:strand:- start:1329 stop:1646 length:318 start_codon:yes stop_codon:yes gene_type:complete
MKKITLKKYKTPAGAAKAFYAWCKENVSEYAQVYPPAKAKEYGYGNNWCVMCEEMPYEGMVWLSLGESMYTEPWTSNGKPEVDMIDQDWGFAEPYNSYVLCFVKD